MPEVDFRADLQFQNARDAQIVLDALLLLYKLGVSLIVGTKTYTTEELLDIANRVRDEVERRFPKG